MTYVCPDVAALTKSVDALKEQLAAKTILPSVDVSGYLPSFTLVEHIGFFVALAIVAFWVAQRIGLTTVVSDAVAAASQARANVTKVTTAVTKAETAVKTVAAQVEAATK